MSVDILQIRRGLDKNLDRFTAFAKADKWKDDMGAWNELQRRNIGGWWDRAHLTRKSVYLISTLAVACTALWTDRQQPSVPAGGTEGQGGRPADTLPAAPEATAAQATATAPDKPKKLEGAFYNEGEGFKLIEARFDLFAARDGHAEWMGEDKRTAFGFLIEGYPSADGKPNSLFPYVVVDDGGQAKVFAWAGENDFAQLTRRVTDLTAESGRKLVVWETTSSGVPVFMAEENLAGGYIIYILPNGEQVRIKLPALGGKLAKLTLLAQPTPEPPATPDRAAELGIPVTKNAYDEAVYAKLINGRDVEGMISDKFKNFYSSAIPDALAQKFELVGGVPLGTFVVPKGENGDMLVCVLFAVGEEGHSSIINEVVYEGVRFIPVVVGVQSQGVFTVMLELDRFKGVNWKGEDVREGNQYEWGDLEDLEDVVYFSQLPNEHPGEYRYAIGLFGVYYSERGWELYDENVDLSVPTRPKSAAIAVPESYADPGSGAPQFTAVADILNWAEAQGEPLIIEGLSVAP